MASERFPSEAPAAKRSRTKETTPFHIITTQAFQLLAFEGSITEHIPRDILDIVFEYTAPTALQTLAADPNAVLVHEGQPTQPYLDALWEVFHHHATAMTDDVAYPHKAMSKNDWRLYIKGKDIPFATGQHDGMVIVFTNHGLPDYRGRTLIGFNGFVEFHVKNDNSVRQKDLCIFASRLYPS